MTMLKPAVWEAPLAVECLWMIIMGPIVLASLYFIIKALVHAPASKLAPLGYFEIICSVLVGLIIFGDFPHTWTWLGIGIIIVSGLYVMRLSVLGK